MAEIDERPCRIRVPHKEHIWRDMIAHDDTVFPKHWCPGREEYRDE